MRIASILCLSGWSALACIEEPPNPASQPRQPRQPSQMDPAPAPATARVAGEIVHTIAEPDLIPEGLAWDPAGQRFFVSSVYKAKILVVEDDGQVRDFVPTGTPGFWGGVGLRIDVNRSLLWAASAMGDQTRGHSPETVGRSALHAFALSTGETVHRFDLGNDDGAHLLNDLVVGSGGEVYVTDTLTAAIYRADPNKRLFERWLEGESIAYPNGIAWNGKRSALFVAHDQGISRVPVETPIPRLLAVSSETDAIGIDGLYLHRDSLIAVQNHKGLNRIARLVLGSDELSIERVDVIAEDHPSFDIPTTGAIVEGTFWIIANSQLDRYENGRLAPLQELEKPRIVPFALE